MQGVGTRPQESSSSATQSLEGRGQRAEKEGRKGWGECAGG